MLNKKALSTASAANANAWDVSYAAFEGGLSYFRVNTQESNPSGVYIKPDGTKMYIVGATNDTVYQYSLSTAWDISTATYDSKSFAADDTVPQDLFFKPDGTKMYILGSTNDRIREYDLSTAWDVTTTSFVGYLSVSAEDAAPSGFYIKPDGTKVYVTGTTNDTIYQYDLPTAWDLGSGSYEKSFSVASQDTFPQGVSFKTDGTKMYFVGSTNDRVYQYSLSTAWDISTASYDSVFFGVGAREGTPQGMFFKDDGTKCFVIGTAEDAIFEISLSTAWDLSTAKFPGAYIGNEETTVQGLFFKSDGTKAYIIGSTNDRVYQYSLSSAWVANTATYDSVSFSVNTQTNVPVDLFFKSDGTKMYILGNSGASDVVYQYSLSTAWDVSTASYDSKSFSVNTQESLPSGVFFKSDGTKMYVLGTSNRTVYQYSLSTAWDVSTASYDSVSFVISSQDTAPQSLFFKDDGTKMYVLGSTNDRVYQYSLSTAWDMSTASYSSINFNFSAQETTPVGISFKSDGTKMYILGQQFDTIIEYQVG
jgi:sugar lactone lactonase YvrE